MIDSRHFGVLMSAARAVLECDVRQPSFNLTLITTHDKVVPD